MYKLAPHVEQLAIHFQIDGNLIHKESEEAKRQLVTKKNEPEEAQETVKVERLPSAKTDNKDDDDEDDRKKSSGGNKKLTNQFNFSDRASQTNNNPLRERQTQTEPPPRVTFSANANQWEIFDAYAEDFEQNVINLIKLISEKNNLNI